MWETIVIDDRQCGVLGCTWEAELIPVHCWHLSDNHANKLGLGQIRLMKALVWPVATYGCESWTLRKNEETHLDAFEIKGPVSYTHLTLPTILRV